MGNQLSFQEVDRVAQGRVSQRNVLAKLSDGVAIKREIPTFLEGYLWRGKRTDSATDEHVLPDSENSYGPFCACSKADAEALNNYKTSSLHVLRWRYTQISFIRTRVRRLAEVCTRVVGKLVEVEDLPSYLLLCVTQSVTKFTSKALTSTCPRLD